MRVTPIAMLITAILIAAPLAKAQSVLEVLAGIKFCRTLKDDAQRLKCFDGLITGDSSKAKSNSTSENTWEITESKSPLDDSPQVFAVVAGNAEKTVALGLRCKEKQTEAFFTKQFAMFGVADRVRVVVRINNAKPIETRWTTSTDHAAVFAPSAIQFIRALPDDGTLFIRAFGYNGALIDGTFNLGKISEVRNKIAKACNWHTS